MIGRAQNAVVSMRHGRLVEFGQPQANRRATSPVRSPLGAESSNLLSAGRAILRLYGHRQNHRPCPVRRHAA
jgi:hypothetical protein